MINSFGPGEKPGTDYYDCRYNVLRKPLGFERGAEILQDDGDAVHAFVEKQERVVAVGRAHRSWAGQYRWRGDVRCRLPAAAQCRRSTASGASSWDETGACAQVHPFVKKQASASGHAGLQ